MHELKSAVLKEKEFTAAAVEPKTRPEYSAIFGEAKPVTGTLVVTGKATVIYPAEAV